jgi:hypothetical protein
VPCICSPRRGLCRRTAAAALLLGAAPTPLGGAFHAPARVAFCLVRTHLWGGPPASRGGSFRIKTTYTSRRRSRCAPSARPWLRQLPLGDFSAVSLYHSKPVPVLWFWAGARAPCAAFLQGLRKGSPVSLHVRGARGPMCCLGGGCAPFVQRQCRSAIPLCQIRADETGGFWIEFSRRRFRGTFFILVNAV